jgi:hypothetical protein
VPKHMLSARQVQVAREGDTHDGEGLILRVQGRRASWVLRYRVASRKRRELGLGGVERGSIGAAGASLTGARELADEARDQLKRGQAVAAATTLRSYANAPMESLNGTVKVECVHGEHFRTRKQARQAIVEFIGYYNTERRHSSLGYLTPSQFERRWRAACAEAPGSIF